MQTWVVIFGQGKAKLNPFRHTEFCSLSLSLLLSIWSYHFCYWVSQVIIVLPVKLTNCGGILLSNLLLVLTVPELLSPLYYLLPVGEMCGSMISQEPRGKQANPQHPGNLETAHRLSWCVCHLPFFPDVSLSSTPPPTSSFSFPLLLSKTDGISIWKNGLRVR